MSQAHQQENFLAGLARNLGASRSGQVFVAATVAAGSLGLAYMAWRLPDLAAVVLSVGLVLYGLQTAWRLLPIPVSTRARWAREQQIAKAHPAWRYQGFLWSGIGLLIGLLWRHGFNDGLDRYEIIFPGILIIIGSFSYIACHRFARHTQTRNT